MAIEERRFEKQAQLALALAEAVAEDLRTGLTRQAAASLAGSNSRAWQLPSRLTRRCPLMTVAATWLLSLPAAEVRATSTTTGRCIVSTFSRRAAIPTCTGRWAGTSACVNRCETWMPRPNCVTSMPILRAGAISARTSRCSMRASKRGGAWTLTWSVMSAVAPGG